MPPKKMLSILFIKEGGIWTSLIFFGIVIFIVLGIIIDPRFYIVALIWIFLFVPLVVAFLYFFYGMKPLTAFNTIPHKIIFSDNSCVIKFIEEEEREDDSGKEYTISETSAAKIKIGNGYYLLTFDKEGWLWLPFSAFQCMDDINFIIKSLNQTQTQANMVT